MSEVVNSSSSSYEASACTAKKRKVAVDNDAPGELFYVAGSGNLNSRVFMKFEQMAEFLHKQGGGFFLSFERLSDALAKMKEWDEERGTVDYKKLTLCGDDIASVVNQKEKSLLKAEGVVELLKEQLRIKEIELQTCKIEFFQKCVELDEMSKSGVEDLKTQLKRKEEELDKVKKEVCVFVMSDEESDVTPPSIHSNHTCSSSDSNFTPSVVNPTDDFDPGFIASMLLESDLSSSCSPTDLELSTNAGSNEGFPVNAECLAASSVTPV